MGRSLILVAALLLAAPAAATEFSTLEERMSAAEFRAAGLDKLTPEELAKLNEWLRSRGLLSASTAGAATTAGFRSNTFFGTGQSSGPIRSEIRGDFRGWQKGDKIRLENGQVWEVIDGTLGIPSTPLVKVTIEPGFMGSWLMKVEGYNATARVRRLR
jgi:hypothetical protein